MSLPTNASTPRSGPALVRVPFAGSQTDADGTTPEVPDARSEQVGPRVRPTTLEWVVLLGAAGWIVLLLLLQLKQIQELMRKLLLNKFLIPLSLLVKYYI